MTNEEIKKLVNLQNIFKISTNEGETFIGIVDGPYAGFPNAKLEAHRKDYVYVTLLNSQQQTIRVYSEDIESIVNN